MGGNPQTGGEPDGRGGIVLILTEAKEEGVHAHAVDTEEPVGDEVGAHDHRLQGGKR